LWFIIDFWEYTFSPSPPQVETCGGEGEKILSIYSSTAATQRAERASERDSSGTTEGDGANSPTARVKRAAARPNPQATPLAARTNAAETQ
jgi:hypothetical protein